MKNPPARGRENAHLRAIEARAAVMDTPPAAVARIVLEPAGCEPGGITTAAAYHHFHRREHLRLVPKQSHVEIVAGDKCFADSGPAIVVPQLMRSEEHTSELQSLRHLVCRLL